MSKIVPAPLLTVALLLVWLVANRSFAPAQILLGAVLGWGIPLLVPTAGISHVAVRHPEVALRLALVVLRDIVVSNVEVARRVLGPEDALRPGFVDVPLALTSAHGIAVLAAIVTLTPGTLTCGVAPDRSCLWVHALHLTDAARLVADIKARYEAPLLELFG
jgi:multicomponent K+:H+ antiporter subunit E